MMSYNLTYQLFVLLFWVVFVLFLIALVAIKRWSEYFFVHLFKDNLKLLPACMVVTVICVGIESCYFVGESKIIRHFLREFPFCLYNIMTV